ncbi:HTH-type transcriptional regulator CdhR [Tepidimonas alkaliphilus]|uniref:HTH-type transcriptional regulator CdhR n=1 Tax=Tepidimonas alkaliphilus TaxID=2588942 RepID=A0A554W805_9BURK|nr:helix-turn-helix domain-containing protein [Tepidimonas alkaliphilus]TSE19700.1 HTH-type transcriptional regulator CdhR [Tepidimonas alkaliphilus]
MNGTLLRSGAVFAVKRTTEVHCHAQNLTGWRQDYEQTSPGLFEGLVREYQDSVLQIFEEIANRSTTQYCQTWDEGVWFGLPVEETGQNLLYMGHALRPNQMMVAQGRTLFDLQVPEGFGLYGVVIKAQQLQTAWKLAHAMDDDSKAAAWQLEMPRVFNLTLPTRLRLSGLLREALNNLQAYPQVVRHAGSVAALQSAILSTLVQVLSLENTEPTVTLRWRRRLDLVHRARSLVLSDPASYLTVDQLCQALYVTRRTLQNCFQSVLGMSPAAYLRAVRLNRVRQELLQATPGQTVIDIAARWGFWHMGHFSKEYRILFAEKPSQTLKRSRAMAR